MRKKRLAAALCAAAACLTMSGCKKNPPGTLVGISISYSGMCYDDEYGFSIKTDPSGGCVYSCHYKDGDWVEQEDVPLADSCWQEALALAEKLGLESLPDEKTTRGGLFVADAPLETLCLIYETPEGETVYRYLEADGDTRQALKDFMIRQHSSCQPKEREVTHNGNAAYQLSMPGVYRSAAL